MKKNLIVKEKLFVINFNLLVIGQKYFIYPISFSIVADETIFKLS